MFSYSITKKKSNTIRPKALNIRIRGNLVSVGNKQTDASKPGYTELKSAWHRFPPTIDHFIRAEFKEQLNLHRQKTLDHCPRVAYNSRRLTLKEEVILHADRN